MPAREVKKLYFNLKALRIQGSSQVRKAIVKAIKNLAERSKARTPKQFRKELRDAAKLLLSARPTEPETRTALRVILGSAVGKGRVEQLKRRVAEECSKFQSNRKKAMEIIAKNSDRLFQKKKIVFTHCHSHTVEAILLRAWKRRRLRRVIATETRPKLQGRITASNLTKAGIPVTLIADSAAGEFINQADIFLTGCDAILANGDVVNKIGTKLISLAAKQARVPHYVASSSHCFDPATFFGAREEIEQRPATEVWEKKKRKLSIENPAFDVTPAEQVKGIISELGVHSPKKFVQRKVRQLGLRDRKFVSLKRLVGEL